jgi:hypothetical protein
MRNELIVRPQSPKLSIQKAYKILRLLKIDLKKSRDFIIKK